jgi:integrase
MRRGKIRVRKYSDSNRPHLKFVVNYREAGARKRSFFEIKDQAQSFADKKNIELQNNGVEHAEFPTALRVMAQNAVEQLKPFGKTITDAVEHYVAHLKASAKSCNAVQLVKEVIAAKKKACGKKGLPASKRYIEDLESRLSRFKKDFDGKPVATITSLELNDWLLGLKDEKTGDDLSPVSRSNYARALGVAFSFAVKRGYASSNPTQDVDKPTGDSKPGVLTIEQTARLLEAASPELLPYIAIGLFAGLRRSEIEQLDWNDIDFEENHIEVNKSKTGERNVEMLPILRDWLMPLRKHSGKVVPENFRELFDQARVDAGITEWPDNALRHSFASYHLAQFNDDKKLKLEMGHWRDSDVLFKHYRRAVKKRDAERYWQIRPAVTEKIVWRRAFSVGTRHGLLAPGRGFG